MTCVMAGCCAFLTLNPVRRGPPATNKKDRPEAASLKPDGDVGQATRSAPLFRRYATKPSPQKPRIIMAQVEGSGTALVTEGPWNETPSISASLLPPSLLAVSIKLIAVSPEVAT